VIPAQLLPDLIHFLREMSGEIPYDQRQVKGGLSRQQEAARLLALVRAHLIAEKIEVSQ
jgi:hypothetical protein